MSGASAEMAMHPRGSHRLEICLHLENSGRMEGIRAKSVTEGGEMGTRRKLEGMRRGCVS